MKAIETKYKGYRFRSRLEARWAVFFDALGLQWEYEPEGFDLGDAGWYLPDFRVRGTDTNGDKMDYWFEVKPACVQIPKSAQKKLDAFGSAIHQEYAGGFILLDGIPEYNRPYKSLDPRSGFCDEFLLWSSRMRPWWVNSSEGVGGEFIHASMYGDSYQYAKLHGYTGGWVSDYMKACNAARSARFEHGENPQ